MERSEQDEDEVYPPGTVFLTDEEHQECQETFHYFLSTWKEQEEDQNGEFVVSKDFAETFQREIIAYSLMRRAERFLEMAGGSAIDTIFHTPNFRGTPLNPDLSEKACVTAAKACAIHPLSIHFYDFGCILTQVGKPDEAKVAFSTFLKRVAADYSNVSRQGWLKQRDIQAHILAAEQMV
jgi:hypothetical protein